MNAWCIGARRRGGAAASTSSSTSKDRANVDAHASNVERLSVAAERGDLHANHLNGHHNLHHHSRSTKKTSDDIELKRGTRRARVCLVVFCVCMVLLSAGRPIYAPYIDVFETTPTPTRRAVSEDVLSPPPSPEAMKEDVKTTKKTKKFRLFPRKMLG